ncbi:MAG: hypothetical protein LBH99_04450 [Rickettsia sp.]|nr:hypothetical protein [Rickettsia sp.]
MLSSDSLLNKRLLKFAGYDFIPYFRTVLPQIKSNLLNNLWMVNYGGKNEYKNT